RSISLGGGSVARATDDQRRPVTLGPESMGALPGPACYGLGGDQPTLTDAFVASGLINPDYFLGGTKAIQLDAARSAIETGVARPNKSSLQESCRAIIDTAFASVASLVTQAGAELNRSLAGHTLFAYGGNGGLFACGVAEKVGIRNIYLLVLGPVFSAFGSCVSDISHVYERAVLIRDFSPADAAKLAELLSEVKEKSTRDLLGEGIKPCG